MSVKKIAMLSNKFFAYLDSGDVRKATSDEVNVHLASLVPPTKNGGILDAVRFNEKTGNAEYRYAHKIADDKVSYKVYAKKLVAQYQSQKQSEPVDGGQDEDKLKENKTNVPRDESKAKPETKFDRPKGVDNPTEVRKKEYKRGPGGEDLHTDVVPRSKKNSGLEGSDSTTFADEKANDATSGKENSYVQKFTPSTKPAPAGKEDNHAVAAEVEGNQIKEANVEKPLNIKFSSEDLMNVINLSKKEDSIKMAKAENADDKDEEKDQKSKDKENDEEKDKKSEDEADSKKKASVDEDLARQLKEAKSQLTETVEQFKRAKIENNNFKIREARMKKAIEYAHNLQRINPAKYAEIENFVNRVFDTVKKMDVEAIDVAIEETKSAFNEIVEASHERNSIREANIKSEAGLESVLVIPRVVEGFDAAKNTDNLRLALMENTRLGRLNTELENYKPHEKTW